MVVSYEEQMKNTTLTSYCNVISDESAIKEVVSGSNGITTAQLLSALKKKYGKKISKKNLDEKIILINRDMVEMTGFQPIIYYNNQWLWKNYPQDIEWDGDFL